MSGSSSFFTLIVGAISVVVFFTISLLLILGCDTIGLSTVMATAIAFIMNAFWWFLLLSHY
ncbi:MAG: hypothetical protein ACLRQF_00525 [Thomasclavelia ramosa]